VDFIVVSLIQFKLHCVSKIVPPLQLAIVFIARRIASAVLATTIPSVRPSLTRRYCVKTTARSTMQFALSDS